MCNTFRLRNKRKTTINRDIDPQDQLDDCKNELCDATCLYISRYQLRLETY